MGQKYKVLSRSSDVAPPKASAGSGSIPAPGSASRWERVRAIVTANGKFGYDDDNIVDLVEFVFESHNRICTNLQECVQRHKLGLGGEYVDKVVIRELDRLLSQND